MFLLLLQMELHQHPDLAKKWRALERREAKLEKAAAAAGSPYVPLANRLDATFIPSLIEEFLQVGISHYFEQSSHGVMICRVELLCVVRKLLERSHRLSAQVQCLLLTFISFCRGFVCVPV